MKGVGKSSRGYNMQLVSGKPFFPMDPRADEIEIEDIAHSLAMQCRFNGHSLDFFSVAQHSVIVSRHVPREYALDGLLHDATEAYCGDVIRPIKCVLPGFEPIEALIFDAIAERFGLRNPIPDCVKAADFAVLCAEKRDLLAPSQGVNWGVMTDPIPEKIVPVSPRTAKAMFLERFEEIMSWR